MRADYFSCIFKSSLNPTKIYPRKRPLFFPALFRPFFLQSDLSVENGRLRLQPKSGFLRPFLIQSDLSVENGRKVLHVFFEPIASLIPPPNTPTRPHGHTPIPGTTLHYHIVVVLTLTRIIKSVVTGRAPVTMELRNTLGKNTNDPRWYTADAIHASTRNIKK